MTLRRETIRPADRGEALPAAFVPALAVLHHPSAERKGDRVRLPSLAAPGGRVALSRIEPGPSAGGP